MGDNYLFVILAKAGIQAINVRSDLMDSRLRGNDKKLNPLLMTNRRMFKVL